MSKLTRRDFTKIATAASVSTALGSGRVLGANDRVRLGFIGVGNRGDQVLDGFLAHKDAEVVAVCDIHQPYMDFAAKKTGGSPRQFKDYRKLLEMKDVDAVVIATPDHWHALQMIHACQAGKDVYVEKPLSLAVAEGRRMVEAAERHKRVVQVGLQRRSSDYCREAVEFIRGSGNPPNEAPPADFDWEAWLGPAPKAPYNKNRAFYRFRWFYDYSGGQLTNMGVHYMDLIHWALGHDAPAAVTAMGGKFAVEDNREIPDTLEVVWQYQNSQGDGALVSFTQINASAPLASARNCDVEFRGTKGALYLMDDGYEVVPDDITPNEFPVRTPLDRTIQRGWRAGQRPMIAAKKVEGRTQDAHHARNFLDCVRSRERCRCYIETGHRSTSATLLGNIAYKTKSYLEWDAKAERFTNNQAANKRLSYEYRAPYRLPSPV